MRDGLRGTDPFCERKVQDKITHSNHTYLKCICVADDVITGVERDWVATAAFIPTHISLLSATEVKIIIN